MAPLLPRMHLFEIDDQPWFPAFLRARVQDGLRQTWTARTPLQSMSPAQTAATLLIKHLAEDLSSYAYVDFCAGGGGPTPAIERTVNAHLRDNGRPQVDFVLTDLHPNLESWQRLARKNPRITYEANSVDASRAPERLVHRSDGKKVMRLFNLAFHHFDDPLARDILKDTVQTSDGFAIFELQERDVLSVITITLMGLGVIAAAPYYAWKWRSPATLIFSWFIPILPFVLVFDGYMSALRTRTADEVEALLRNCGADANDWVIQSGRQRHLWPCGYMNYIICRPEKRR
ncbi:hypothetical protein HJFPF1_08861 [Paramyrothecium foliicola]|nr:hypothetical protein HJFPF1_08861 [Paramyrothecium foliicola]